VDPKDTERARDMVMLDPWGALLEQLLKVPEHDTSSNGKAPSEAGQEVGA
jgi:hypothetical protein